MEDKDSRIDGEDQLEDDEQLEKLSQKQSENQSSQQQSKSKGGQKLDDNQKPITKHQKIEHTPQPDFIVQSKFVVGDPNTKIFCVKFDYEDKYIACACENGEIRVFNAKSGKLSYNIIHPSHSPFSYVRWRPPSNQFKTKNVFVSVNSDGEIQHHHLASGKLLSTIQSKEELDPQLYCIDYNVDATRFGVCGSQPVIRIYDEEKRVCDRELGGVEGVYGHNSRVYCIKFDKENPNICFTGGWDKNIIIWDFRDPTAGKQKNIYGPLICGDGIDVSPNHLLSSSWTETEQLCLWDIRSTKCSLVQKIDWNAPLKTSNEPTFLYAGQFSKTGDCNFIMAGGSNTNEVKIFDKIYQNKAFCVIYDLCREVDTVDFGNQSDIFCFGGGDGYLRVFSLEETY